MQYDLVLPTGIRCTYSLLTSSRAKYIRIKITPPDEIKVVVPCQANAQLAHDFVQQRKHWINKTLLKIDSLSVPTIVIPQQLLLNLTGECWHINYRPTSYKGAILNTQSQNHLSVEGNIQSTEVVFDVLEKWLKTKAKLVFPEKLAELSKEFNLPYHRVTIRGQKTRWGSCSSKQNISLNYKLLFLPEPVVRYVFIHELCHTREMNHSKRFWKLVEQCDPNYQQHQQTLKATANFLPAGF